MEGASSLFSPSRKVLELCSHSQCGVFDVVFGLKTAEEKPQNRKEEEESANRNHHLSCVWHCLCLMVFSPFPEYVVLRHYLFCWHGSLVRRRMRLW